MQITQQQAEAIAKRLFPDLISDGSDCKAEIGREGLPCRPCQEKNEAWTHCLELVKTTIDAELS